MWFIFRSRRRHTRSLCAWSSDVCSSDLVGHIQPPLERRRRAQDGPSGEQRGSPEKLTAAEWGEVGRASCRERVQISVVAVSLKKKDSTVCHHTAETYDEL